MVPNLPTGPGPTNVVPVLLVHCANCGYMLHINALVAGIVKEADWVAELSRFSAIEDAEQVAETSG